MFGGAGIDLARNVIGDAITVSETVDGKTSTNVIQAVLDGHARDADYMMGDNANVYRLVGAADSFRTFNYDNYPGGIGQSAPLYRLAPDLLKRTAGLLDACRCEDGCPSCVGPVGEVGERGKAAARRILAVLIEA